METQRAERPLGELFSSLARETGQLVQQHVELAKSELAAKAMLAGKTAVDLGAGWLLLQAGALALMGALILILALFLPLWASAAIVGAVVVGGGAFLLWRGATALRRLDLVPHRTLQNLKDDQSWLKKQTQ